MTVIRFCIYSIAAFGIGMTILEHAEAAWRADPLSSLIAGSAMVCMAIEFVGKALGFEE